MFSVNSTVRKSKAINTVLRTLVRHSNVRVVLCIDQSILHKTVINRLYYVNCKLEHWKIDTLKGYDAAKVSGHVAFHMNLWPDI